MKLKLDEATRQKFVDAGRRGGKATLKNKGKKHFRTIRLAQLEPVDSILDSAKVSQD